MRCLSPTHFICHPCQISRAFSKDPLSLTTDGQPEDDDEKCATCSGAGQLLTCDECQLWFHYTCCDPPMEQADIDDRDEWFCSECTWFRTRPDPADRKTRRGLFSELLTKMERSNPVAFALPSAVRDFFEDVSTGVDGEYEEAGLWVRA